MNQICLIKEGFFKDGNRWYSNKEDSQYYCGRQTSEDKCTLGLLFVHIETSNLFKKR